MQAIPALVPLICGMLSAMATRTGALSVFFLLPIGFAASVWGKKAALLSALVAFLANIVSVIMLGRAFEASFLESLVDIIYFSIMLGMFLFSMLPLQVKLKGRVLRLSGEYRLCIAALVCFIAIALSMQVLYEGGIDGFIYGQAEAFSALFQAETLNVSAIADMAKTVLLRGAMCASLMLLFYFTRVLSLWAGRLVKRLKGKELSVQKTGLVAFHIDRHVLWIFAGAVVLSIVGNVLKWQPLEIASWNLLVMLALLYLGQGYGIVMAFIASKTKRRPNGGFFPGLLFVIILMTPMLNMVFLAILALLGIAENWLPLRQQ
ncbi:MAG: hypothetical protein LBM77_09885 [Spirochaetaceae bacterium]|jgi:hypothetical protein|nr:hypothetical protein [Spirochaetaceae bacterium]